MGFNNHCGACPKCHEPIPGAPYGALVLCDWCSRPTKGSTRELIISFRMKNPAKWRTNERSVLAYAYAYVRSLRKNRLGLA